MTVHTRTMYRLEVRPLTLSPFKKITIWNTLTQQYDTFRLARGKWATAHRRTADGRAVFGSGFRMTRLNSKTWATDQAKKFKRLGFATNIIEVQVPKYPNLSGDLDADADVLEALQKTATDLGVKIKVVSGKRTYAEQAFLYDLYLAGKGNLAAKPGTSRHESGRAADAYIGTTPLASYKGGKRAAAKRGLSFPVPGEPWHSEL